MVVDRLQYYELHIKCQTYIITTHVLNVTKMGCVCINNSKYFHLPRGFSRTALESEILIV